MGSSAPVPSSYFLFSRLKSWKRLVFLGLGPLYRSIGMEKWRAGCSYARFDIPGRWRPDNYPFTISPTLRIRQPLGGLYFAHNSNIVGFELIPSTFWPSLCTTRGKVKKKISLADISDLIGGPGLYIRAIYVLANVYFEMVSLWCDSFGKKYVNWRASVEILNLVIGLVGIPWIWCRQNTSLSWHLLEPVDLHVIIRSFNNFSSWYQNDVKSTYETKL